MAKSNDLFEAIRGLLASDVGLEAMEEALWDQFEGLYAPLVLDSCGFTRITQARGVVHFLACFVRCRDIVRPIFERHGCASFRAAADNIYSEFPDPDRALEAAFESNEAVAAAKIMLTRDEPFRICIGIGYGRVLRSQHEGVFGNEMNLASKLGEDTAAGGEVLLTESAYSHMSPKHKPRFEQRETSISGVRVTYYLTQCGA